MPSTIGILSAVVAGLVALAPQAPTPATPTEPIAAILSAFASHDLVALGEGAHGSSEPYAFRLALIGDPRFADIVNDIVVETGNARHQDRIDAYVRGEDVPRSELEAAWLETTQDPAMTSSPVYEGLFTKVREVNRTRDAARRLRVLLADPPGEWRKVPEGERRRVDRDSFAAAMIRREVVSRKRRALLVYGDGHLPHRNRAMVVGQLEASGSRVFSIWTTTRRSLLPWQPDVLTWTVPSFALVRGTTLGSAEVPMWFPEKLEDQFDAVMTFDRFTRATRDRVAP